MAPKKTWQNQHNLLQFYIYSSAGSRSSSKRPRNTADEEEEEEDLTADMEDPSPENNISEVKATPANAGKADMQPS